MASDALVQRPPQFPAGEGMKPESLELVLYWRGIYKRKWWVLGFALATAALVATGVTFLTPIYRASVTLMIEQTKAKLVSIEEVYSGVSPNREHYQTQAEMLRSPALAARVIEKLGLLSHPEFDPRQRKSAPWAAWLPATRSESAATPATAEKLHGVVLTEFLRRMTIEPVRLTQLVKVGFDAADPELAARIANTIADTYIEADIETRARMRQRATDWLADRLQGLKGNLEGSERALQQYRERESLPDTKGLAQSGAVRQIEALSTALNEATERRVEAEANYGQLKDSKGNLGALPMVLRNSYVDRLKDLESQAERRAAEVAQRYGPDHARMLQAQNELKQARDNTRRGIEAVMTSFAKEYQTASANERAAQKALAASKGSVQNMNRKEFQLDALEQDLTANRQIYEKFMTRYRETRASGDTQSSVARIIDPAVRPGTPYKPRKTQIVGGGFMLGLVLAAVVALMVERVSSTIKSAEDVEEKLGLPTLAIVPLLEGDMASTAGRYYLEKPNSVFSEAIRTARTSILLSSIDVRSKVLLVTSSVPNEGKSSFAINLALAHSQTKKTLLIEADLRRPSVVRQLGLNDQKPGLTSLFTGMANFSECVQRVEGSSLYVLPSGPTPDNPLELLSSDRFRQMIARVADACDVVIIDSPPVHLVSDAVVLSTLVTGVIFVVKADGTPYPMARRSIRTLQEAGASVIGVTLNQLDFSKAERYYGAYTGYSKEYGAYYGKAA